MVSRVTTLVFLSTVNTSPSAIFTTVPYSSYLPTSDVMAPKPWRAIIWLYICLVTARMVDIGITETFCTAPI